MGLETKTGCLSCQFNKEDEILNKKVQMNNDSGSVQNTCCCYTLETFKPAFLDHFGGRKSEDFAENPLPRISMFTSSRCWSDFGRISQQIRGFQIDYECGL
jgi:hypothetical protein